MIYQSYNFVDSYSNASGNRKNSMVLGELGKLVRNEPQAVASALRDAGVRISRKPSRKDLVRLIIANKRNRKLSENLAVLITLNAQNMNFLNANGEDELLKLPTASAQQALTQLRQNQPTELQGTEKGGWLKGIGDFFKKRSEEKAGKTKSADEPSGWNKFKDWFSKNRETIGQIGGTIYTSLDTANQNNIPTGDGGNGGNGGAGSDQTWIQRNKVLVLVGILAVAGGIYFMNKGSKGK